MSQQQNYDPNYNPQQNQSQQQNYNNGGGQQSKVTKVMNATIVTGEYQDKTTGQNKKSYLTIGKLFIYGDGGMSLKLDALPHANQSINFYDIKSKSQPNQQHQQGYNTQNPPPNYNNNNNGGGGYQG